MFEVMPASAIGGIAPRAGRLSPTFMDIFFLLRGGEKKIQSRSFEQREGPAKVDATPEVRIAARAELPTSLAPRPSLVVSVMTSGSLGCEPHDVDVEPSRCGA
jgi:hypothetical protein